MNCCQKNSVIELSHGALCKKHFLHYFERKVYKTIRQFNLIENNDTIGVAVSGGKDSLTLLSLLHTLVKERRNITLKTIFIDEGIEGYRENTLKDAQAFCEKLGVELNVFSFKEEYGYTQDEIIKRLKIMPCSACGVLRRNLLNTKAKALGVTKLATGHNLDDEVQSIMMNEMKGNLKLSARLGPMTGIVHDAAFIPRIKPLYLVTEKEVMSYAFLHGIINKFTKCPYADEGFRSSVRDMLNNMEHQYPGTKHGMLKSFLEVLPTLKEKYRGEVMSYCKECNEPSSRAVCNTCLLLTKLKETPLKIS